MASGFIPGKSTSFHGPLSSSYHSVCPPGNDPVNTCSAYVISEIAMSNSRSFPAHPSSKKSLRSLPVALEKAMISSSSQTMFPPSTKASISLVISSSMGLTFLLLPPPEASVAPLLPPPEGLVPPPRPALKAGEGNAVEN